MRRFLVGSLALGAVALLAAGPSARADTVWIGLDGDPYPSNSITQQLLAHTPGSPWQEQDSTGGVGYFTSVQIELAQGTATENVSFETQASGGTFDPISNLSKAGWTEAGHLNSAIAVGPSTNYLAFHVNFPSNFSDPATNGAILYAQVFNGTHLLEAVDYTWQNQAGQGTHWIKTMDTTSPNAFWPTAAGLQASPVPLPAAAWLGFSMLTGMGLVAKLRKRKHLAL